MIEYDVAVAYNTEGIKTELSQRGMTQWRLVYGYQAAPGLFGFSDGGHVLVFMREQPANEEIDQPPPVVGGY
jgi:hypothetical protein